MGTLTAGQPRLAEYCAHKLPTSCRLSSIPECCACADERAHATAYSTYIDGVGYVLRGSRWQRYCWFCKEFWQNRVEASGLRPAQTRIPQAPDQTTFLERWYEFHQGYRLVTKEDGTQERIAVVGEDFREVSPGVLPRTLDELRQGRDRSAFETESRTQPTEAAQEASQAPNLEDTLDRLFEDASNEQSSVDQRSAPIIAATTMPDMTAARGLVLRNQEYQTRRIAALRRELYRMRNGIERVIAGLRELGQDVPDHREATGRLESLGRTLDDISGLSENDSYNNRTSDTIPTQTRGNSDVVSAARYSTEGERVTANLQARVDEAREVANEARRMRDQVASEYERAQQEVRATQDRVMQLQREQRTTENYIRLFGTREDIVAQGDAYESPIGGMFSRAYDRFRAAEDVRLERRRLERSEQDGNTADSGIGDHAHRLAELDSMPRDVWGVPQPTVHRQELQRDGQDQSGNTTQLMEMARDEVFAGQTSQTSSIDDRNHQQTDSTDSADRADVSEAALEEYYGMLRRQGWAQTASPESGSLSPALMQYPELRLINTAYIAPQQLTVYELTPANWLLDARFLLSAIMMGARTALHTRASIDILRVAEIRVNLQSPATAAEAQNTYGNVIDPWFADDQMIWLAGVPAEWFRRSREAGALLIITAEPRSDGREEQRQNIEAMAEAFQMSSNIRRRSSLTGPEQLSMLYRLQRGERDAPDRSVLWAMLGNDNIVELARTTLRERSMTLAPADQARLTVLTRQRQRFARDGDFSRTELDARRQSIGQLALAANRTRSSISQGMLDSLMDMEREHREEMRSLDMDDASPRSQPQHRVRVARLDVEEDDDAQGLDAKDSGRPEPKDDEEMTMKLECRICYAQIADVACLPCGHLVMCKWCSDQHSPTMNHDKTRPRRPASCPVCRKSIRQKVRVFRA